MKCLFLLLMIITGCQKQPSILNIQRNTILVTITGAVDKEYHLSLPIDSKLIVIADFITVTKNGDSTFLNQNITLKNNDIVYIPLLTESKISINNADVNKLIELPSIGKIIARRIIEFREKNGLFQNIEEVMLVKGIKEKTFEKIRELICL